jgi:DNA-binding IclR family transcriptional regulator
MKTLQSIPTGLNGSVWSACDLINYLVDKGWCRIKDISQALDMDPAKVHRLLNTLVVHDFIQYDDDTHRYQLGFKFLTIAYHMSKSSLISTAKPHLEYAASELFETINLGVLANDKSKLIHIYRVDGNLASSFTDVPLGVSRYANESALGKCIMAYLSYGEQQSILSRIEYRKYTENSITNQKKLEYELALTKERGYAVDDGEIDSRVFCVAMPVFTGTGDVLAAVSVSMIGKPSQKTLKRVISVLKTTTDGITRSLGYR